MADDVNRDELVSAREFRATVAEIQRAVDLARESPAAGVDLLKHIEERFADFQRAMDVAEREREKAALALHSEQQHATDMAERERSKAAENLARQLAQSIKEGDERLREHIGQQVEQIRAALVSSEALQLERAAKIESGIDGAEQRSNLRDAALSREIGDRFAYTETAVAKAEAANEKRFASVNEFRAQLSAQAREFMPREVADAQLNEIRKLVAANTQRIDQAQGVSAGGADTRTNTSRTNSLVVAAISTLVGATGLIISTVIAVNALTTH